MVINHNMNAMNAHRQMIGNTATAGKSMEKLSSGLRINRAGDDAAGLAISETMRGQIRGLNQASRNSQDGISLIQTAEGALNETHSILQRMRELGVQAANDTNTTTDRGQIQKEINQLTSEINRIGNTTEFNTMKLLNGDRYEAKVTGSSTTAATTAVNVKNQSLNVNSSTGVTLAASGFSVASNKVSIASSADGYDLTKIASGSASYVKFARTASGDLAVSIKFVVSGGAVSSGGAANGTVAASDVIAPTWDASNNYTYNAHGVSFTISKADFDAAGTTNSETVIDYSTTVFATADITGSKSLLNDWVVGTGKAGDLSPIVVDSSKLDQSVRSISVQMVGSGGATGSGSLQVHMQDASGNLVASDTISLIDLATNKYTYNNFGVSFTVSSVGSGTVSMTKAIEASSTTTAASTSYTTENDSLTFQVGANEKQSMSLSIKDMRASALGLSAAATGTIASGFVAAASGQVNDGTNATNAESGLDVSTSTKAANAVTVIQTAIDKVSDERAKLGAYQNRLEHTIANLDTSSENLQSSESRIRDVDMAKEMMTYSKNNILAQAAQSMLAQANQQPQQVLSLLR